jgi:hypothetical protein
VLVPSDKTSLLPDLDAIVNVNELQAITIPKLPKAINPMMNMLIRFAICFVCVSAIGLEVTTEYGRIKGAEEHDPKVTVCYFGAFID